MTTTEFSADITNSIRKIRAAEQILGACREPGAHLLAGRLWECRGPERVLHAIAPDDPPPPIGMIYPDTVRAPGHWTSLDTPTGLTDKQWADLLEPSSLDGWYRALRTLAAFMHSDPGEADEGLFERAALAEIHALAPEYAPTADDLNGAPGAGHTHTTLVCERPDPETVRNGPGDRHPCGCGDDGPCLWGWAHAHRRPQQPHLTWRRLHNDITDTALIRAARDHGIPEPALKSTKSRTPATPEPGLWERATREWNFQAPITSRMYGLPIVTTVPCSRYALDTDIERMARYDIVGFIDDLHVDNPHLAGPGGSQWQDNILREFRDWAHDPHLRHTASILARQIVWDLLLETAHRRPGDLTEVARYDLLSCAERQAILICDVTLTQFGRLTDTHPMWVHDHSVTQCLNGYSDLVADIRNGIPNNALLLGVGLPGIPGQPDSETAYAAISRSIAAVAAHRHWTPGGQVVAGTPVWNAANGRHRVVERATGLSWEWLNQHWPVLTELRALWQPIENDLVARVYQRLGNPTRRGPGQPGHCSNCGNIPQWAAVLHDVMYGDETVGCALTRYILCRDIHASRSNSADPGAEFTGAVAAIVRRYKLSGALYELYWILCGAIWFWEALMIRASIVELVSQHHQLPKADF